MLQNTATRRLSARQQIRLAISADAVLPVKVLALVFNHFRAAVTVLRSTADGHGCLKESGSGIRSRAVTVADLPGTTVRGKSYSTLISTGKEEERLALAETTGLLDLGNSRVARY